MTRVFNDLIKEGYDITDELIDAFSPYRMEHINRFGSYSNDHQRELLPLQYNLSGIKLRK